MLQQSSHSQENLKKYGSTLQLIPTLKSVQCAQINIGYDIKDVVNGTIQQKNEKIYEKEEPASPAAAAQFIYIDQ